VAAGAGVAHANVLLARRLPGSGAGVHKVESGQSLWGIARTYGCMPDDVRRANDLEGNLIYPGQVLRIPVCADGEVVATASAPAAPAAVTVPGSAEPSAVEQKATSAARQVPKMVSHKVVSGDSLYRLARRYDTSVIDIQVRNGLTGNTIFAGQTLEIAPGVGKDARAVLGQSLGSPSRGKLLRASRLGRDRAWYRRRLDRTYGAAHVINHVRRAITAARRKHRKTHSLAIGDISARRGGRISGHKSHQSGRDVDLGFYYSRKPRAYPEEFVVATPRNLDFDATWSLLLSLAATADADGGVERIFLGYDVQKLLYDWARRRGYPQRKLNRLFQYPHGRYTPHGLVRHEPGHNDHFHVRYKCLARDKKCK